MDRTIQPIHFSLCLYWVNELMKIDFRYSHLRRTYENRYSTTIIANDT